MRTADLISEIINNIERLINNIKKLFKKKIYNYIIYD